MGPYISLSSEIGGWVLMGACMGTKRDEYGMFRILDGYGDHNIS